MTRDLLVQICLEQPEAIEDFPFGEHVSVFKVGGKMFALLPFGSETVSVTVKCDPVKLNPFAKNIQLFGLAIFTKSIGTVCSLMDPFL